MEDIFGQESLQYEDIDLYHYTSLYALNKICKNRTIRLTDYRFLNDETELKYGVNELESFITNYYGQDDLSILKELLHWVKKNHSLYCVWCGPANDGGIIVDWRTCTDTKIYTLSLTHGEVGEDNPFMWKNYAPKGCRIKFNSEKLLKYCGLINDQYLTRGSINLIKGEVIYGNAQRLPLSLVNMKNLEGINFMFNAFNEFYQLCALHKTEKYKLENEYRIGYRFLDEWFIDNFAYDMTGQHRLVRRILPEETGKPQIELLDFPIEEIIQSIVVSPWLKGNFNLHEIEELCEQTLGHKIPVEFSLRTIEECEAAENL